MIYEFRAGDAIEYSQYSSTINSETGTVPATLDGVLSRDASASSSPFFASATLCNLAPLKERSQRLIRRMLLQLLVSLVTFRDRQEISWTIWGPSVPQIWSRPIERNHRRSCSTSRISRLRSDQRWGAIGHSKVQVISCRSLRTILSGFPGGRNCCPRKSWNYRE